MRVYISKSNLSCPYLVDMVRRIILEQGHTTIEHHGDKPYDDKDLLTADALVIIPAREVLGGTHGSNKILMTPSDMSYGYYVGKGQFMQINLFINRNARSVSDNKSYEVHNDYTIICIEEVGETEIYCGGVAEKLTPIENGDWKVRYAKLEVDSYLDNLKICLSQAQQAAVKHFDNAVDIKFQKIQEAYAMVDEGDYILKIEKPQLLHLACRRLFNR